MDSEKSFLWNPININHSRRSRRRWSKTSSWYDHHGLSKSVWQKFPTEDLTTQTLAVWYMRKYLQMDWRILNTKKTAHPHRRRILTMSGYWIECTTRNSHQSTRLFFLFINDLPDDINNHMRLFADDCILPESLVLRMLAAYRKTQGNAYIKAKQVAMAFNAQKCYVLRITHSHTHFMNTHLHT